MAFAARTNGHAANARCMHARNKKCAKCLYSVELKVQGKVVVRLQESVEEGGPPDTPRQNRPHRAIHLRHRGLQGADGHLLRIMRLYKDHSTAVVGQEIVQNLLAN